MNDLIKKAEHLPVGVIATTVGLATLSNIYAGIGFEGVRHVTMIASIFVWVAAFIKMTVYHKAFRKDYSNVVPASLYATFTMLTMILGNYIFNFHAGIGRIIWLAGVVLHFVHILIFTYQNVIKGVKRDTFVPSWFVTYMGFLVSTVVGVPMGMPLLLTAILYYAFPVYTILIICMIYRMIAHPVLPQFELTKAIFLAPSSLLFVGYLNAFENPIPAIVFTIYGILFITIIYVACKLPSFLSKPFNPGHAALTFPTAIATVATSRMSDFLTNNGWGRQGELIYQFFGIQLWITTAIMAYVGFNFLKIFVDSCKNKKI